MLTNRQISIFKAIVDEFTRTAEPVGSKRLMDLLEFTCSSATMSACWKKHIPPADAFQAVKGIASMLNI